MDNTIQRRFDAAVKVIRSLPEDGSYDVSDEMLVVFYSYYKQATAGPCNSTKPNVWDPIGAAKWEAWKALGNMPKDQAMMEYVQEIQLIIETLPVTDTMAELMDAMDPFYEMVENDTDSELALFSAERGGSPMLIESEQSSGSSFSSDTHSSLNTEDEEEELSYSRESSDDWDNLTQHEWNQNREQSMNPLSEQNKGSGVPRVFLADGHETGSSTLEEQGGNTGTQCGSPDGVTTQGVSVVTNIEDNIAESGSQYDAEKCKRIDEKDQQAINARITTTLVQLQNNMKEVMQKLSVLEDLTATRELSHLKCSSDSSKERLPRCCYSLSMLLMVVWPFAVHWLMQMYVQKRRK